MDDSAADNFFHRRVITKAGVAEEIIIRENGQLAIDYLTTPQDDGTFPRPELIFLDINMPVMNGWAFLAAYEQLPEEQRAHIVITMLTTSASPTDRERAQQTDTLMGFEEKPLTVEKVLEIVEQYF